MPSRVRPIHYGRLLVALVAFLIAAPLADKTGGLARFLIQLTVTAVLLAGVVSLSKNPRRALMVAVPVLAVVWLPRLVPGKLIDVAAHVAAAAYFGIFCIWILRHIFEQERVTLHLVAGALCMYLLLGLLWCYVYGIISHYDPEAFRFQGESISLNMDGARSGMVVRTIYFSFVTLLTLGYGDIVPHSETARMCAIVETLMGQVILVVLVAMLVGKQIVHAARGEG